MGRTPWHVPLTVTGHRRGSRYLSQRGFIAMDGWSGRWALIDGLRSDISCRNEGNSLLGMCH